MYSDEIIRQELIRYSVTDSPVSDNELARWKASFVNINSDNFSEILAYAHGRSYFWSRLTQSIDMPEESTVDEVMTQIEALRVFQPQFEIGIQIAMRMLGKPIEEAKHIIEPFESIPEKKKGGQRKQGRK